MLSLSLFSGFEVGDDQGAAGDPDDVRFVGGKCGAGAATNDDLYILVSGLVTFILPMIVMVCCLEIN